AISVFTFCAPAAGSCLPCTVSSRITALSVYLPPAKPAAFACSIARSAPFALGRPTAASCPLSGKSIPILIVAPLAEGTALAASDGAPVADVADVVDVDDVLEQAASIAARTAAPAVRESDGLRMRTTFEEGKERIGACVRPSRRAALRDGLACR